MMKREATANLLKAVVIMSFLAIALLFGVLLPMYTQHVVEVLPTTAPYRWPMLAYLWLTTLPVLASLVMAWKLFSTIALGSTFCQENVNRLTMSSRLALLDLGLYLALFLFMLWKNAMPPFLMLSFCAVFFLGFVAAIVCFALAQLTSQAVALKQDNDLTI